MLTAEDVRPGATLVEDGKLVYVVESVRIERRTRIQYDAYGEHVKEQGRVSLLVRYLADGGDAIRRFEIGALTPLENADPQLEDQLEV